MKLSSKYEGLKESFIHLDDDDDIVNNTKANSAIQRQFSEMKAKIESAKYKKKIGKKLNKNDEADLKKELTMDEHIITIDELCNRLGTSIENGLSAEEAERRLRENGKNVLTPPKQKSKLMIFLGFAFAPFSILLWIASVLCFITYGLDTSSNDNLFLAVVIIVVIMITAIFAYAQSASSAKVMEGFKKLIPVRSSVIRNGKTIEIDAALLTVGDLVVMKAGEKIPADVRIVEASALKVDNSSFTGEVEPISRIPELTNENPLETKNLAFFSTSAIMGSGKGIIIRTGDDTAIGRIAGLASSTQNLDTPIRREMNHFVVMVSTIAIVMAIIYFIVGMLSYSFVSNIIFVVGILVANVPEGVLVSVSVCLTLAAKRMASKNVLVKNLESVETLGSTSTICSDKTGTLTMNQMTVQHLWYNNTIYKADSKIPGEEPLMDINNPVCKILNDIACLCNNARFKEDEEGTVGDASESALIKHCQNIRDIKDWRKYSPKLVEIPFNSTNKFQVSVHDMEGDRGHYTLFKGAPERVLARCSTIAVHNPQTGKAELVELTEKWKNEFQNAYDNLGGRGERVLGFCYGQLNPKVYHDGYKYDSEQENWTMDGLTFAGLISLIDPPRPAVPDAVRKCKEAGIRVVMVTGDHPITAKAIAKQVGIISMETKEDVAERLKIHVNQVDESEIRAIIVNGTQLLDMTEEEIDDILERHDQIVFARTSPQQKLLIVEGFQRRGEIVAVTGDGVNDSPALKKADIGVAMGITGSDVSKEAADMILLDDNFASIVKGVEEGRVIFDNLKKTIAYLLTANIPQIFPFTLYVFFKFPLPLTTILMLCVCVGTDLLPAISLSYERAESDIMKRKPRDPINDKLVTVRLISFSYLQAGIIQAISGFFCYIVVMGSYGFGIQHLYGLSNLWEADDKMIMFRDQHGIYHERDNDYRVNALRHAQTACFVGIVLNQWGTLLMTKTRKLSIFQQGMWNWLLNIGLLEETLLALALCYLPFMRYIFKTKPLAFVSWITPLPFTLLMVTSDEIRKFIMRKKDWRISKWVEEYSYY